MRGGSAILLLALCAMVSSCKANREFSAGDRSAVSEAVAGSSGQDPGVESPPRWRVVWPASGEARCALEAHEAGLTMNSAAGSVQRSWVSTADGVAGLASVAASSARVVEVSGRCVGALVTSQYAAVLEDSRVSAVVAVEPLRAALEAAVDGRRLYRDMVRQHVAVWVFWRSEDGEESVIGLAEGDALGRELSEVPLGEGGAGLVVGWPQSRPGSGALPLWLVVGSSSGRRVGVALR